MSSQPQCQENYTNLVTSIVAAGVLIISEILPFIESLKGNGIVHAAISALKTTFPTAPRPSVLSNAVV